MATCRGHLADALPSLLGTPAIYQCLPLDVAAITTRSSPGVIQGGLLSLLLHHSSAAVVEVDVTVVSMFSQEAKAARGGEVPEYWERDAKMETAMQKHLGKIAQDKINKYKDRIQYVFHPFVLSPGGYLHKETEKLLEDWHEKMEGYGYGQLLIDLSIGLIRNRAHCLVL
jgi:hypothetical protein